MTTFSDLYDMACLRKGGKQNLQHLLPKILTANQLKAIDDSRYLAMMAKGINQAGFHWQVIENKWPQFEEAFFNFDVKRLSHLSDDAWANYMTDTRVVRNWQKIEAVQRNAIFLYQLAKEHGSASQFFADWSNDDQLGLVRYLKKNGSRLGGMTGALFLRRMGRDTYLLSTDVCVGLNLCGLDLPEQPTSLRDLKKIQETFTDWHTQTGLPYSHISKIIAYAVGENYPAETILGYMKQDGA